MKAVYFNHHGDGSVLEFGDIPKPEPAEGYARIKVSACALNHLDIWVRKGWKGLTLAMPHVGGSDIVGTIDLIQGSSNLEAGERVMVYPGVNLTEDEWTKRGESSVSPGYRIIGEHIPGGLAEYVCVPVGNLYSAPEDFTDDELAASLLVATTCWRMLFKRADLKKDDTVLVVGSGGGVNSLSIQLCKALGATVYALCGGKKKEEKARNLGADVTIDYQSTPAWHKEILMQTLGRGVDLVIDNVGAKTLPLSLVAVRRGGRVVTVGNTSGYELSFDNRLIFTKQISYIGSTMGSSKDFQEAIAFMQSHSIRPAIDTVAPLSDGIEMIRRMEQGQHFGKIVLKP